MLAWAQKASIAAIPLAVAALLWAGSIGATVATLGRNVDAMEAKNSAQDAELLFMREMWGRIDERLAAIKDSQDRIIEQLHKR